MNKRIISIWISITLILSIFIPLSSQASSIPSSWAVNEVNKAVEVGLVTDSVSADYQANITREQFCEMVVLAYERISGKTAEKGNESFNDTDNSEILKAAALDIVEGYGDGTFRPNDLITREQIAIMLVRMIEAAVSYINIYEHDSNNFADSSEISAWAMPYVNFAYDEGLMQGVGGNRIDPLANTTCEQAVLLVYRASQKYHGEGEQLNSIYELKAENIRIDDETYVHYTNNIVLAFIESGLSDSEKNRIADIVDGEIAAQLSGGINLLQIEVEESSFDELNNMAEELMNEDEVYYAAPDVLSNIDTLSSMPIEGQGTSTYAGENEWWIDAIEAKYVWDRYDSLIKSNTVGVIDDGVFADHEDFAGKVSFLNDYYDEFNQQQTIDSIEDNTNHGTGVTGIIIADRNDYGITGVANKSNVVFASYKAQGQFENDEWYTQVDFLYALQEMIDMNIKAVNCSFGAYYYTENFYNENKNEEKYKNDFEEYPTYRAYLDGLRTESIYCARAIATAACQLIKNGDDFLAIQGTGNGENNAGPGVSLEYSGTWATITEENVSDILNEFNISYEELNDRIIVVGAVDNIRSDSGDYSVAQYSNFGDGVDICAPGGAAPTIQGNGIRTCNATGVNDNGESTWYDYIFGTSIATPMVTGTAAILWGIDPSLTAAEVKDCIINGAKYKAIGVTGEDEGREYPMLNVRGAVEQLTQHQYHVYIVDKETLKSIEGAVIECDGMTVESRENGIGRLFIDEGVYKLKVTKGGYKEVDETLIVENTNVDRLEAQATTIYMERVDW